MLRAILLIALCGVVLADDVPFPPTLNQGLAIVDSVLLTLMYFSIVFFGFEYSGHKNWVKLNAVTVVGGPDVVCGVWFMERAQYAGGLSIYQNIIFLIEDPNFKG